MCHTPVSKNNRVTAAKRLKKLADTRWWVSIPHILDSMELGRLQVVHAISSEKKSSIRDRILGLGRGRLHNDRFVRDKTSCGDLGFRNVGIGLTNP